jgi:hypothetical protein
MPDLIGHFGVQGVATRGLVRSVPVGWILLGATLPDAPWIAQRMVHEMTFLDPYRLRLYFVVQSSLMGCALLAAALAACSRKPRAVFGILVLNSALHLVLDALQTKWANGVHLVAPFSWHAVNLGLFWPESLPNYALQALGLVFLAVMWRSRDDAAWAPRWPGGRGAAVAAPVLAAYVLIPFALLGSPGLQENAFVSTFRDYSSRTGKPVEFDRNWVETVDGRPVITAINDEKIRLEGDGVPDSGLVSIRGRFTDRYTVRVEEIHVHSRWLRDSASYLGLGCLLVYLSRWLRTVPSPAK